MQSFLPTIGLEIHAELKTKSKMFCGCKNDPNENEPNSIVCPICMAHPGTLPVINKTAVSHVLRVGTAVGGVLANFTEFDRKNYFYPDIPKNYQISQYKYPLVSGGLLSGVSITRIHLEEDTARSIHTEKGSKIDYNRAGVPLMELVTDPVITSAEKAAEFAKELRLLLMYLGVSNANLEKGEMRIEANVSISDREGVLGTKVEVKNLNSFRAVEQAIKFEIKRHTEVLMKGGVIVQETRGWDENKQKTFSQRKKEDSHDYRYYPDPDLPKIFLNEIPVFEMKEIERTIPKLPEQLRNEYTKAGLRSQAVEILVNDQRLNSFYQKVITFLESKDVCELAVNYITTDLLGLISKNDYDGIPLEDMNPDDFATIVKMVFTETISSRGAKEVLLEWTRNGEKPEYLVKNLGISQISDESVLVESVRKVISEHESVVKEYKNGKESSLQFLVGMVMKETRGAANPVKLQKLIKEFLV